MGRNAYDSIRNDIAATYSQELERISTERRLMNIQSFAALDRRGLGFVSRERRVLLHSTSFGERIFVQYPGKESERRGPDERPWDFRPKLVMRNGIVATDLSFIAVWTDLQDVASGDRDSLPVIATLLFRMAKRRTIASTMGCTRPSIFGTATFRRWRKGRTFASRTTAMFHRHVRSNSCRTGWDT